MARPELPPSLPPLPLVQSPVFAAAVSSLGADVEELVLPFGRATVLRRRFWPGICVRLLSRGPVWTSEPSEADRAETFRHLSRSAPCLVTPGMTEDVAALRTAGFRQILTAAHLAEVSLDPDIGTMRQRLAGSWRNALGQAERRYLHVTDLPFDRGRDEWLLARENAQRARRGYRALPTALVIAMAAHSPNDVRILSARLDRKSGPLSGIIVIRHGSVATYHIGWTGSEGRHLRAGHLLLWHAMCRLADKGVTRLDLGTVDGQQAPGLMRFKLGTGAQVRALGGTWARLIPPLAPTRRT